jgi:hypothetical protein
VDALITFSGSYSGGSGQTPNFTWTTTANGQVITIGTGSPLTTNFSRAGTYPIDLTVTDPVTKVSASASISLTINSPSYPPLVVTINSPTDGSIVTDPITFSGSYSGGSGQTPPTNDITWTAIDTVSGASILLGHGTTVTYSLADSTFEIQFTVFDPVADVSAETSVGIKIN